MNTHATSLLAACLLVLAPAGPAHASSSPAPEAAGAGAGPVYIESAEIAYLESWPVQVRLQVRGSLPTPCHELAYEVQDLGTSLDVQLWSLADPDVLCTQVLEPFEISIDLGSYTSADLPVRLNGDAVGTIDIDDGSDSPGGPMLTGAGWSFGLCVGYCAAELAMEGDELVLTGHRRTGEPPLYLHHGTLTTEGRARLDEILARLEGTTLEPVYGCPDCADGGAAHLEIVRDGDTQRVELPFAAPPDPLAELYAMAMSFIHTLETCGTSAWVEVAADCVAYEG